MRRARTAWGAAVALCLLAGGAAAVPYTPTSDSQVVERLPVATDPTLRAVESLRRQLASRPADAALRLDIAERYFGLAMAQGDARYVGYALATLGPAEQVASGDSRYWLVRGQLQQYGHDFEGALRSLQRATELAPQATEPIAWRAAIHMVQARYALAAAECDRLAQAADPLFALGCSAYVRAATGQLAPAYDTLAKAVAGAPQVDPGLRLWLQTRLAEMAVRLQRWEDAERHYRAALALGVTDQFLLASYADFLLQRGRPAEVLQLLAGWERSDILLLRLALAGRATKDRRSADWNAQLRSRFEAAAQRGDRLHEQEAARWALDLENDPAKALAHATSNYKLQKEARDAEMLMRAALAAKQPAAAQPALGWLKDSGYEDPALQALAAQLGAGR
jgi:tetratricopeptide (TPR) repeat protein